MSDDASFSVHVFRALDPVVWKELRGRFVKGSVDPWAVVKSDAADSCFEDLGVFSLSLGTPFCNSWEIDRWGLPEGLYAIYVPASTRAHYIGPAWQFADYRK